MKANKEIRREGTNASKVFDERSVEVDYRTIVPLLREGLNVLDVGCGTGAISNGIAKYVGPTGRVTGIDNTADFIERGKSAYGDTLNLTLRHADLFDFETTEKFDLIVSARTLQWLSDPGAAIRKMREFLRPGGTLSVLDYNHSALEWNPDPPQSMKQFYDVFLKWRADAGMHNTVADALEGFLIDAGFKNVQVFESNEIYRRGEENFVSRVGIWSTVAGLKQIVEEGYLLEADRLKTIAEYDRWVATEAQQMIMKLKEVRGNL